jgi:hypothetical protein
MYGTLELGVYGIFGSLDLIVHTSSGVSSMYLKGQSAEIKALFSNPDITLEELERAIKEQVC